MTYEMAFARLARSKFRSRFALTEAERAYVAEKGMETIRRHAEDFVRTHLADAEPRNDGRQTPMRGHPVFKAQHATATCCRGCLNKWWHVPKGVALSPDARRKVVDFIMAWIERQCAAPLRGEASDGAKPDAALPNLLEKEERK